MATFVRAAPGRRPGFGRNPALSRHNPRRSASKHVADIIDPRWADVPRTTPSLAMTDEDWELPSRTDRRREPGRPGQRLSPLLPGAATLQARAARAGTVRLFVDVADYPLGKTEISSSTPDNELIVALAGIAAELRLTQGFDGARARLDLEQAFRLADCAHDLDGGDVFIRKSQERARSLVDEHWPEIKSVASDLLAVPGNAVDLSS